MTAPHFNPNDDGVCRFEAGTPGCTVGWGPGCDSYTRGHLCNQAKDHRRQPHQCDCGHTLPLGNET